MHFEENYFKPEVIEGFEVKGMMKRYWASSMEVLAEVDRICRKNKLRYFAFYGTLLGAVRHQNWIPWDDDLDIIMYRDDYNRFIAACKKDMDPVFDLFNVEKSCLYPLRIINTHVSSIEPEFLEQFHGCPYPTGIDIYVMDKVPTEPLDIQFVKNFHQVVRYISQQTDKMFDSAYGKPSEILYNDVVEVCAGIEEFTGEKLVVDETLAAQLTKLSHRVAAMYNDTRSPYLARINNWAIHGDSYRWEKKWFDEVVYLPFGPMKVPCPKMYHEVLVASMGKDYMTPKKFLNSHAYPAYKKDMELLLNVYKACNAQPPAYYFE